MNNPDEPICPDFRIEITGILDETGDGAEGSAADISLTL